MPAQTNATLESVHGADTATGGRDSWDDPGDPATGTQAATGPLKWTGPADAYYLEAIEDRGGAAGGVVNVRALIIDTAVARAAGIDTDDVLTFTDPAGTRRTARAARIRISALGGLPARLQTSRLELEQR